MHAQQQLPQHKYGLTRTKYNLPAMPSDLPERGVFEAANKLNAYLYSNLTNRQRVFVEEYFGNGFNELSAASVAGLVIDGDPKAPQQARALLKKKHIIEAIDAGWNYYRETVKVSLPEVVAEIRKVAFANMADYLDIDADGDPRIRLPGQDERHLLAAINELTIDEYKEGRGADARECRRVKFKLYSKMDALEKLLKLATASEAAAQNGTTINVSAGNTTTTTNNSVTQINLIAVPSGKFIDAPVRDEQIIERKSMLSLVTKPTAIGLTG